jgi:cellulose synthase/poly-beta-1,6-N-acetylglucosamine synthase-like glycosyltransferase
MRISLKNFLIPAQPRAVHKVFEPNVSAVVPTYKPGATALRLVEDLLRHNPKLSVVVVDDCTPLEHAPSIAVLECLRLLSPRVTLLRTPRNRLKAGALNLALAHLLGRKGPHAPAVVLTLDDDVVIAPETVPRMTEALLANPRLGAVCSRCGVLNKNANVLTRLQGLEYVGFNAIRLADQGFMRGPLVMHGMLTAFRARALRQAGGFAEGHLIEDYEMTTRLKSLGWEVLGVLDAPAWTEVPERLRDFWRQRTRWSLGGVQVVLEAGDKTAVLQDILGHIMFISTLALIAALLVAGGGGVPSAVLRVLLGLSVLQFASWYALQVWLMRWYPEKDAWDWLLRVSLVPELLFSGIMTLVLLGSYAFIIFSGVTRTLAGQGGMASRAVALVTALFAKLGYSEAWGTRTN